MLHTKVTICACSSRSFIDKSKVTEIVAALKKKGYEVSVVPDLCRSVMQKAGDIQAISEGIVMACHPRAIRSHFDWLGLDVHELVDIRHDDVQEVISRFPASSNDPEDPDMELLQEEIGCLPVENGTDAWYPVIDKERCTECGKCHDFCLFGVYTVENQKVRVVNPQHCKNNCPACARMCPNKAIIFPKYEKSPINGGTAEEETFHPEEMDRMYRERLRMRLQQRREGVSLLRKNNS